MIAPLLTQVWDARENKWALLERATRPPHRLV